MGGALAVAEPIRLCFWPHESALAARVEKDGGGGSGELAFAVMLEYMGVVLTLRGNKSSSSGSRSASTEEGKVDDELCRAEADKDSL